VSIGKYGILQLDIRALVLAILTLTSIAVAEEKPGRSEGAFAEIESSPTAIGKPLATASLLETVSPALEVQ
jgi:hypothetical protein